MFVRSDFKLDPICSVMRPLARPGLYDLRHKPRPCDPPRTPTPDRPRPFRPSPLTHPSQEQDESASLYLYFYTCTFTHARHHTCLYIFLFTLSHFILGFWLIHATRSGQRWYASSKPPGVSLHGRLPLLNRPRIRTASGPASRALSAVTIGSRRSLYGER